MIEKGDQIDHHHHDDHYKSDHPSLFSPPKHTDSEPDHSKDSYHFIEYKAQVDDTLDGIAISYSLK